MQKAALFYNPLSGGQARRLRDVDDVLAVLRAAAIEVSAAPTRGHAETGEQVRHALAQGCDTVLACGGDGTIHDIAQALVGTNAALGIIPMGTANALAHDLQVPRSPIAAAQAALAAKPRRIAVGRIEYRDLGGTAAERFFLVTAGIGVDAKVFSGLDPLAKRRLGMASYYAKATYLWLTDKMETFDVELAPEGTDPRRKFSDVSQLLAVRIRNFGGVLRELAPGASLERDDLCVVLFRTRSRTKYLAYIVRGLLGAKWRISGVELCNVVGLQCDQATNPQGSRVFVEADGELLGTLPARISIVPNALNLLIAGTK